MRNSSYVLVVYIEFIAQTMQDFQNFLFIETSLFLNDFAIMASKKVFKCRREQCNLTYSLPQKRLRHRKAAIHLPYERRACTITSKKTRIRCLEDLGLSPFLKKLSERRVSRVSAVNESIELYYIYRNT